MQSTEAHEDHPRTRRPHPQPAEHRSGSAARPADGADRAVGLGQVLAGLRHPVRRGPAPLRRVAVGLRTAVPVDDGQARRRQHRGPVARDRHRAEGRLAQPALHRRHGHRDLRLPAAAVRARRAAALPGPWHRPGCPERRPDGRSGAAAPAGDARAAAGAAGQRSKGEHAQLLSELAAQGFVRVRIDGTVHEIDAVPPLDPQAQAHASRRWSTDSACGPKPRSAWPSRSRPRWSSARRHARVVFADESGARAAAVLQPPRLSGMRLLRCRHSSRACFRSTIRPAPARAATAWACRSSSIRSASSRSRNCRSPPARCAAGTGTTRITSSCCRRWRVTTISTSTRPGSNCPSACARMLLYGSGEEQIEFRYTRRARHAQRRRHAFEGIMPNLERRWRESESQAVREELGKYRGTRPCADCDGTRLNEAARAVLIDGRNIAEITRLTVGQRRGATSPPCSCPAGAPPSPSASCARSASGCAFWPTWASITLDWIARRHALGRRNAAHPARQPGGLGSHRRDVHPR